MQTLEQRIDHFCRLLEQKGYTEPFESPNAKGSLRECLNYFLKKEQQEGKPMDYFVMRLHTISETSKEDNTMTRCFFRMEFDEKKGLSVTHIQAERYSGELLRGLLEFKVDATVDIPSKKELNRIIRMPHERQSLVHRLSRRL